MLKVNGLLRFLPLQPVPTPFSLLLSSVSIFCQLANGQRWETDMVRLAMLRFYAETGENRRNASLTLSFSAVPNSPAGVDTNDYPTWTQVTNPSGQCIG
jgi:hypothetical protein